MGLNKAALNQYNELLKSFVQNRQRRGSQQMGNQPPMLSRNNSEFSQLSNAPTLLNENRNTSTNLLGGLSVSNLNSGRSGGGKNAKSRNNQGNNKNVYTKFYKEIGKINVNTASTAKIARNQLNNVKRRITSNSNLNATQKLRLGQLIEIKRERIKNYPKTKSVAAMASNGKTRKNSGRINLFGEKNPRPNLFDENVKQTNLVSLLMSTNDNKNIFATRLSSGENKKYSISSLRRAFNNKNISGNSVLYLLNNSGNFNNYSMTMTVNNVFKLLKNPRQRFNQTQLDFLENEKNLATKTSINNLLTASYKGNTNFNRASGNAIGSVRRLINSAAQQYYKNKPGENIKKEFTQNNLNKLGRVYSQKMIEQYVAPALISIKRFKQFFLMKNKYTVYITESVQSNGNGRNNRGNPTLMAIESALKYLVSESLNSIFDQLVQFIEEGHFRNYAIVEYLYTIKLSTNKESFETFFGETLNGLINSMVYESIKQIDIVKERKIFEQMKTNTTNDDYKKNRRSNFKKNPLYQSISRLTKIYTHILNETRMRHKTSLVMMLNYHTIISEKFPKFNKWYIKKTSDEINEIQLKIEKRIPMSQIKKDFVIPSPLDAGTMHKYFRYFIHWIKNYYDIKERDPRKLQRIQKMRNVLNKIQLNNVQTISKGPGVKKQIKRALKVPKLF